MTVDIGNVALLGSSSRFARNWEVFSSSNTYLIGSRPVHRDDCSTLRTIDIQSDLADLKSILREQKIGTLINCVAMTDVDRCEKESDNSYWLNAEVAARTAAICRTLGIKFQHISTDHFQGSPSKPLREDALAIPVNQYGRSKLKGEALVLAANPDSLIIRTNFFGLGSKARLSFSEWIVQSLLGGNSVNVLSDVYFTPVYAASSIRLIERLLVADERGIYNIASVERVSKFAFARMLADAFNLDKELIHPIKLGDRQDSCPRPLEMALDTRKVSLRLKTTVEPLDSQLRRYVRDFQQFRNAWNVSA